MMITEHNCEDYFLLYLDNELTTVECGMVEDFLAQYPQYLAAFNALRATKLSSDDTLSFFNKASLYKDETSDIGINNYEEYFLLYTDNELSKEQKETTERFVLQHPQLQEEFTLLQQTKLVPELIEYRNKNALYKKERRVLPFYITGLSVAAAVFAVLFFTGLFAPGKQLNNTIASASVKQAAKPVTQPAQKQTPYIDAVNVQEDHNQKKLLADKAVKEKNNKDESSVSPEENHNRKQAQNTLPQHPSDEEAAVVTSREDKRVTQPVISGNNITAKQVSVLKPLDDEADDEPANTTTALSLSDNNIIQPAVYKELNTDDDNRTLYVSALRLNKNKVNGFLKSASRLLGGRAKQTEQ